MSYERTNWEDADLNVKNLDNMEKQYSEAVEWIEDNLRANKKLEIRAETVDTLPSHKEGRLVLHDGKFKGSTGTEWREAP